MCKYVKLREMKDNFVKAAIYAECDFMRTLWAFRARCVQAQIDRLTPDEAMEEVK